MELLHGREDCLGRLLNGSEKFVRCDKTSNWVLDGRQSAVHSRANEACKHVRLVDLVDLAQINLATRFELQASVELIGEDGLVETGGKFVGLLHKSGACQAW